MKTRIILWTLLFFLFSTSLSAQSFRRLLSGEWTLAEINRYGQVVPAYMDRGDYFGFDFARNGNVEYESTVGGGNSFILYGDWDYHPANRTLIVRYFRRRSRLDRRFQGRFRPSTKTYYVERLNRRELILRDRNGGRDFVLLAR